MPPTLTMIEIFNRIKADKIKLGITLFAPASLSDISKFEKARNTKLPDDIKTFYSLTNGFESDEDLFRIIPLQEIVENMKDRDTYTENKGDFHIAEYLIYSDMWTLRVNASNPNQYEIYNKAESVVVLTNLFSEFLTVFLDKGVFEGLYSWRKNIVNRPE